MAPPTIHATALPNHLSPQDLLIHPDDQGQVAVDPGRAGWRYLSLSTVRLEAASPIPVGGPGIETAVVLLAGGSAVLQRADAPDWVLPGRAGPFDGLPSAWYLPPGTTGQVAGHGRGRDRGESTLVAIATAPASGRDGVATDVIGIGPGDIRTEIRGAGNATRQVSHIIDPSFPADRLEVVEILTPSGNWSSWPPHKHDVDDMPDEAVLEEVYYYWFPRPEAWGIQRVYRPDRSRDGIWEVKSGDLVLVPDGYHPFSATHGDHAWYLNALAGDRRTMACSFDPDLDWVRDTWPSEPIDPRVPLVTPPG